MGHRLASVVHRERVFHLQLEYAKSVILDSMGLVANANFALMVKSAKKTEKAVETVNLGINV